MVATVHSIMPSAAGPIARSGSPSGDGPRSFDELPETARDVALQRAILVRPVVAAVATGVKVSNAIDLVLATIESGRAPSVQIETARALGRGGKAISRGTLQRWVADFQAQGLAGLAPSYKGRVRETYGWEARALYHYQRPTRPAFSTVAHWLRDEGFETATDSRVRRYLQSLPATETSHAPSRVGRHYHDQNVRPYVVRDHSATPVGLYYQGDGHRVDVYIQHPVSGGHYRPELTAWIDVRSHYLVGWWLADDESAVTTLYALSHAIVKHDHVPAAIHTDPGSGFQNRMMDTAVTGYLARLSIEPIRAIPGNAKGKGLIERWFGIFEERCGKLFETYCGHCRTDDLLSRLETKVRRREIDIPTAAQFVDAVARFVEAYNHTPQKALGGRTPAELWAELVRTPIELPVEAIIRPQELRRVRRTGLSLFNLLYRHEVLAAHEGSDVIVEYDLHDGSTVIVRDRQGRFLCEARRVVARPGIAESRIEQLQQKRLEGQRSRLQRRVDEIEQRAGLAITHDQVVEGLDHALFGLEEKESNPSWAAATAQEEETSGISLDITSLDW